MQCEVKWHCGHMANTEQACVYMYERNHVKILPVTYTCNNESINIRANVAGTEYAS